MLQITLGTNTQRKKVTTAATTSLRDLLEENEINYEIGTMHLDGAALSPGDLDKTFADFGITEKAYLLSVVKAENAGK